MKIKRRINQRTFRRFNKMLVTAAFVFCVQYLSEKSMTDIIDAASDYSNDEYDWSLPFVTAAGEETEFIYIPNSDGVLMDPKDPNRVLMQIKENDYKWLGESYKEYERMERKMGFVEEFYDGQQCHSSIMIPGTSLIGNGFMGFCYLVALIWLFLGIGIISDIFMESIETITAQQETIKLIDNSTGKEYQIDRPVWNETVANLTLMALGSSAPEILLSVIQTCQDLTAAPPVLGASTIVGSAAFNLLVITGVSILAVDDGPKKIKDTGVFFITSVSSLFAYIWLFLVLGVISVERVELWEGWLTLFYFIILICLAYGADRIGNSFREKEQSEEELAKKDAEDELKIKKNALRQIAKSIQSDHAFTVIVEIAEGITTEETKKVDPNTQAEIRSLYKQILNVDNLKEVTTAEFFHCLKSDDLLERFAYRRQAGMGGRDKEFIKMKGQKGQIENTTKNVQNENENIGFKCLHYSVTESNGTVEVTILKKKRGEYTFGVRTVDDTATSPKDYTHQDKIITIQEHEQEIVFSVPIVDDEEWEPDLDFKIELYDPGAEDVQRLPGDDTQCVVTILDEDFPGTIGFEMPEVSVQKGSNEIVIVVTRSDGSDGVISCQFKTDQITEQKTATTAIEFEDYCPVLQKITFPHNETELRIPIQLVNNPVQPLEDNIGGKIIGETDQQDKNNDEEESEEEELDVMFQVKLLSPEPNGVKISKKNTCIVTICKSDELEEENKKKQALIEYFMNQQSPTWGRQFVNAVMLGPTFDEDNLIVEDVTLYEAFVHFCSIGWNVIFAIVPPAEYWKGKGCFLVSLGFIGGVTAIVGELGTVFGCAVGLKESITAITIVALGTSLPDTFASMTAAKNAESADAAIGNITGSNSVNVFLGLGMPWAIASTYWAVNKDDPKINGQDYFVPSGELAFSVFVFLVVACVCFVILIFRRIAVGGELGGPDASRYASCALCISLWVFYILMSTLQAYGIMNSPV